MATIFCRHCNNLMGPREDRVNRKLVYFCKPCNASQDAESPVVFKMEVIKSESDQLAKVPDDIITDPTLERCRVEGGCPKCQGDTAVRITPPVGPSDNRIKIIFVCCNKACIHKWRV